MIGYFPEIRSVPSAYIPVEQAAVPFMDSGSLLDCKILNFYSPLSCVCMVFNLSVHVLVENMPWHHLFFFRKIIFLCCATILIEELQ